MMRFLVYCDKRTSEQVLKNHMSSEFYGHHVFSLPKQTLTSKLLRSITMTTFVTKFDILPKSMLEMTQNDV